MDVPALLGIESYDFRLVFGRTKIEYDEAKENKNRKKHLYSLESAVHFFERLMLPVPQKPFMTTDPLIEKGEVRHNHMGVGDSGEIVFFVTTMRNEETVRIISFRKANEHEIAIFEAHFGVNWQSL